MRSVLISTVSSSGPSARHGPGWWIVFVPLLWLAVIVGVVYLFRGRGRGGPWASRGRETGIEVLERRFAEGELSLEQYRERRSVLEEKR